MRAKLLGSAIALLFVAATVQAGEVTVKGAHLCCGACVKAVNKALPEAEVDRDAKTITIPAANAEEAEKKVATLAKAGFGGKATFDGKEIAFPKSGAEKAEKADSVTFTGVHLCCGGCAKAVGDAFKDVGKASCDRDAKTCTVKGENIDPEKAFAALMDAGFYGKVKK